MREGMLSLDNTYSSMQKNIQHPLDSIQSRLIHSLIHYQAH